VESAARDNRRRTAIVSADRLRLANVADQGGRVSASGNDVDAKIA